MSGVNGPEGGPEGGPEVGIRPGRGALGVGRGVWVRALRRGRWDVGVGVWAPGWRSALRDAGRRDLCGGISEVKGRAEKGLAQIVVV